MAKQSITVSLPKPCDENWDTMTPADKGRHCAMCQKTVVDFTLMSDGEIIDIFRKAKDAPPCGHFLDTQLDRTLVDTRYQPSFMSTVAKRAAAMLILFQSVAVAAMAQQAKPKGHTTAKHSTKKAPVLKDKSRHICGTVIDYDTRNPMPNIFVRIVGTDIYDTTDNIGGFMLSLPDSFNNERIVLEGYAANAKAQEIKNVIIEEVLTMADIQANKDVTLYRYVAQNLNQHDVVTVREITTSSGIAIHQEAFITKPTTWQRITKPFRKKRHY